MKAVLHGDQQSVLCKIGTKKGGHLAVLQLFGQEEDQVVGPLHLLGQPCFHRYTEIGLSYDANPSYGCKRTETACLRQEMSKSRQQNLFSHNHPKLILINYSFSFRCYCTAVTERKKEITLCQILQRLPLQRSNISRF